MLQKDNEFQFKNACVTPSLDVSRNKKEARDLTRSTQQDGKKAITNINWNDEFKLNTLNAYN